jgi:CBS domain-containing protein
MTTPPTGSSRCAAPPGILDDDPPLSAVMSRDVVAIDAEARLTTALHIMATTGVRHLPVVDRGHRHGHRPGAPARAPGRPAGAVSDATGRAMTTVSRPVPIRSAAAAPVR